MDRRQPVALGEIDDLPFECAEIGDPGAEAARRDAGDLDGRPVEKGAAASGRGTWCRSRNVAAGDSMVPTTNAITTGRKKALPT